MLKLFVAQTFHMVCDYTQVKVGASTWWFMGSSTYTAIYLQKVCALVKVTNLWKDKFPSSPGVNPELY